MRISDWSSDVCSSDLATLASGHALMEGDSVRFLTRKAGILEVRRIGPGYELDLPAWESVPKALPDIVAGMRQEPAKTLWREGGYGLLVYEIGRAACRERVCQYV